jgi:hypothetical protein
MKHNLTSWLYFPILLICIIEPSCNSTSDQGNIIVQRAPGTLPQLLFACELSTDSLETLFANHEVVDDLKALHAGISLALPDYSLERAKIVQQLNLAGIPVTAWLVLPRDEGYYLNSSNAAMATSRFASFEIWTSNYNLKWSGVGLDIEPGISDFTSIGKDSKWKLVGSLLGRSLSLKRKEQARIALLSYASLISKIRADRYPVQTYQLLFMADERKANSTILDRVFGLVPAKADQEVLMVYSSFNHIGPALVYSYGPNAQVIAIGSTSNGDNPALNAKFAPLSWSEFSEDLVTASHFSHIVAVYSLEGCIQQGFLSRLKNFDWDQKVIITVKSINQVTHFRKIVGKLIWTLSNWIYVAIVLVLLISGLIWRWRSRRKKIRRLS